MDGKPQVNELRVACVELKRVIHTFPHHDKWARVLDALIALATDRFDPPESRGVVPELEAAITRGAKPELEAAIARGAKIIRVGEIVEVKANEETEV